MGAKDRSDVVEVVRAQADLCSIVSDYLPLKKSTGSKYRGLCPFHAEKTPSFYVDADKQLFYCFGCSTGGDVFKFLMLYEKLEFPEALRTLAARYGIAMPEQRAPESSDRSRVLAVNRRAVGWYREQLQRHGEKVRRYLGGRGITDSTIERFQIGYAPEGWGGLKGALEKASVSEAHGVLAGLLARKEDTGRTYDRFRDRVIFPIVNLSDEVIGFGGRVLGAGEPKYLNSPETPAFSKGENLYGIGFAREGIRKEGYAVLVEGYLDVIALHQAGVTHAVATLGTGFTTGHVRLLKRFTDRVVVNFDPDAAGRAATRRSIEILLENGFEVNVVSLPAGKDPDVYVREEGAEAYRKRLREGPPYIEFLTRDVAGQHDLGSTRGKVGALNEILPFLARLDNPVRRAGHVEMIATVLGIEDRLILQELKDAVRERRKGLKPEALASARGGWVVSEAESRLLRSVLDSEEVRRTVLNEMEAADLESSRIAEVLNAVRDLVVKGENVTYPRVASLVSDGARDIITRVAALPHPPATLDEGRACLLALRASRLEREMGDVQKRLESADNKTEEKTDDLLRLKLELKRRIEALHQASPLF